MALLASLGLCAQAQNSYPEAQPSDGQQPSGMTATVNGQEINQQQMQALNLANQALVPLRQSQWEAALGYLQQALALDPNCVPALLNSGLCSNQLQRFAEGINYSQKVTQLAPERYEAWVNLGSSYQGAGRLADAVRTYQEYLRRFPNEAHRTQVQSLVKALSSEVARQNAVNGGQAARPMSDGGGVTGNTNDYFAYSVPDSIMKWMAESMPIKVYVPSDTEAQTVPGYDPEFGKAMLGAFKEWASRSNGAVSLNFVPRADGADIECRWAGDPSMVRTPAEGGDAQILANVGKGLRHVTITILTHPDRTVNAATQAYTIYATALHEVGHSLGITGHSPDPNDVMFSTISPMMQVRRLTDRDLNTLTHLYRSDVKTGGSFQASSGDPKSDLSNEATNLMQQNDFAGATKKLEAALKIDPNFQVAKINLAVCLTNSANQMAQSGKFNDAITHYKKALELLRGDSDNARRGTIMKNYASMLYNTQHPKEAQAMEAEAAHLLQGGK